MHIEGMLFLFQQSALRNYVQLKFVVIAFQPR